MFADEPTGNPDSSATEVVLSMLRRAVDELDQTVVIVTHDRLAAAYADRFLFLEHGHVVTETARLSADQILDALKALRNGPVRAS